MAYSKEIFEAAQAIIDERRAVNERDAERRRKAFAEEEPLYADLLQQSILLTRDMVKCIGQGEKAKELVEQANIRRRQLHLSITELLRAHGYPADYLETKYTCRKCKDYGFEDTAYCTCFTQLLKKLAFEEAAENTPLTCSRFEDFSLDYYSADLREHMEGVLNYCKDYAATFDRDSYSVLMYGETGLGKTHLSLAIAGEVIKKGYYVLYDSTQSILNRLEREHFGKGSGDDYEKLLMESDLLILDDLGTEFSTQFTLAALYNILNTRLLRSRPTIISTNLDLKGIENHYTKRIASRIVGEYELLQFVGSDIRQCRKAEIDAGEDDDG